MLNNFFEYFSIPPINNENNSSVYDLFIEKSGGKSFGSGIFNSFSKLNIDKWNTIVAEAYPDFKGKFRLFGYDWLGRCFGVDLGTTNEQVLLFEIGTGDVLEIPVDMQKFLNEEIPDYAEDCLAESFFHEWINTQKTVLKYGQCVGYKVPLFLGGEDDIPNLELCDMEVYWGILSQLKSKIMK